MKAFLDEDGREALLDSRGKKILMDERVLDVLKSLFIAYLEDQEVQGSSFRINYERFDAVPFVSGKEIIGYGIYDVDFGGLVTIIEMEDGDDFGYINDDEENYGCLNEDENGS